MTMAAKRGLRMTASKICMRTRSLEVTRLTISLTVFSMKP